MKSYSEGTIEVDWDKLESELYHQLRNYLSRPQADKVSKETVENLKKKSEQGSKE